MVEFHFQRTYRGPLKAVIFDWAGTTVDFGCFAPTAVFLKVFDKQGVPITIEEARGPMGLFKKDHIRAIAQMPAVAQRWEEARGHRPTEDDVEAMFQQFVPLQLDCLTEYADPILGAKQIVGELHDRGLKVGSTTGYTREMMDILVPKAARRGYQPDIWVCASDVPAARPCPWMIYENAMRLGVYPMEALVKIGDTIPDIEEGLNAGMWTIGTALSGNELGLTEEQMAELSDEMLQVRREQIYRRMYAAGAHYVVDGVWACSVVIAEIERRVAEGEKP